MAMSRRVWTIFALLSLAFLCPSPKGFAAEPLTLVVMDPLAGPLACDCVEGYAQRKYEVLGKYLEKKLGRKVNVAWAESLDLALKEKTNGRVDVIVGKSSVVSTQAKQLKIGIEPVARLSGKDGAIDQWGLLVVRADDKAQSVNDLKGYRIFFGPAEAEEKSEAVMKLMAANGISVPSSLEVYGACIEATKELMKLPADVKAAAVISSYAQPLLEGCKAIKKGDLRAIARSESVPFVTAFVASTISKTEKEKITAALLEVGDNADLLIALETLDGFVSLDEAAKKDAAAVQKRASEPASSPVSKKN
jgi:ABC-type phosphate/phosphonate transport system substrate-binding protein